MFIIKDVTLELEPIGLSEKMAAFSAGGSIQIETAEKYEAGKKYYLGMELVTGDICEVAGEITEKLSSDGVNKLVFKITECDEKFAALLSQTIKIGDKASAAVSEDQPIWAYGVRQTNGSYAVIVNSPGGLFNAAQLKAVSEITAKGFGVAKLTHAQRIILLIKPEQLEEVEEILKKADLRKGVLHHGVRNIRACSGALCKWSVNNDAIGLSLEIDKQLYGFPANFDVKLAISDCSRNCSESYCADIGFIGIDGNYRVVVGGRGAGVPFRALELIPKLDKKKVVPFAMKFIDWYKANAMEKERICKTLQRLGTDIFNGKTESEQAVIKSALETLDSKVRSGDGVSESARLFEQYLRGLAVDKIRNQFLEV